MSRNMIDFETVHTELRGVMEIQLGMAATPAITKATRNLIIEMTKSLLVSGSQETLSTWVGRLPVLAGLRSKLEHLELKGNNCGLVSAIDSVMNQVIERVASDLKLSSSNFDAAGDSLSFFKILMEVRKTVISHTNNFCFDQLDSTVEELLGHLIKHFQDLRAVSIPSVRSCSLADIVLFHSPWNPMQPVRQVSHLQKTREPRRLVQR